MTHPPVSHVWTVAEAKTRLSELLRRCEEEGPQRIGVRKSFVVVPAELWRVKSPNRPNPWVAGWSRTCRAERTSMHRIVGEPARLIPFI